MTGRLLFRFSAVAVRALATFVTRADAQPEVTMVDVLTDWYFSDAQLSPGGKQVSYVESGVISSSCSR
jgi:hypothetical protein